MLSFFRSLSVQGITFRLLSVFGIYQGWLLATCVWSSRIFTGMTTSDPNWIMLRGGMVGIWQVVALTAALWCAAQIFDDLKANKAFNETLLKAFWRVGLFLLLAEIPGAFIPVAQVHPDLPFLAFPVYLDYLSLTLCAIAACLMLVAARARRMRTELEQFV